MSKGSKKWFHRIALFTDKFTHLHNNTIQRGHEAILGCFVIFAGPKLPRIRVQFHSANVNMICEKDCLLT